MQQTNTVGRYAWKGVSELLYTISVKLASGRVIKQDVSGTESQVEVIKTRITLEGIWIKEVHYSPAEIESVSHKLKK